MFMFVCDGFNLDLNMKLKTDNQNFNKKIIMKKLVLVVAMFMFACGSFFTDPVKKDPKKEVKDTAKTEPKKEVADTTAITVAASGAFAQFAE